MNRCFDCGADVYEEDPYFHFGYCVPCFEKHIDLMEGRNFDLKGAAILIGLTILVWGLIIAGLIKTWLT